MPVTTMLYELKKKGDHPHGQPLQSDNIIIFAVMLYSKIRA